MGGRGVATTTNVDTEVGEPSFGVCASSQKCFVKSLIADPINLDERVERSYSIERCLTAFGLTNVFVTEKEAGEEIDGCINGCRVENANATDTGEDDVLDDFGSDTVPSDDEGMCGTQRLLRFQSPKSDLSVVKRSFVFSYAIGGRFRPRLRERGLVWTVLPSSLQS